jgi:N-carbamoylputrescine amidase
MSRLVTISTSSFPLLDTGQRATVERNRTVAVDLATEAGERGSDMFALPETFSDMHSMGGADETPKFAEPIPGPTSDALSQVAKRYGMYILCPIHYLEPDGTVRNTCAILDRRGDVVGMHHKTHPMMVESQDASIKPGKDIPVFSCGA